MSELLCAETVGPYLVRRGLAPNRAVEAAELGGGVSNIVLAARADGREVVVKQSLPRLRVAEEWLAKRERAITEAEALRLAARLTPGAVPEVLDLDREECALVIARAPAGWRSWKDCLLAGEAEPQVAERVGELLATWHRATWNDAETAARFGDSEAFEQLRVDPYHRTVMRRAPQLAQAVGAYVERMLATRHCLVHGDYSPKNVLVGADGLWVLDFEVAHVGDPAFDLAFMLNHLTLKALQRPAARVGYRRCALAFWRAYREHVAPAPPPELAYVLGQVGCLMVARVDGKSPAEYLSERGRAAARELGTSLLLDPPDTLAEAWALLHTTPRPSLFPPR